MKEIRSKRSIYFYTTTIFSFFTLISLSAYLAFIFLNKFQNGVATLGVCLLPLLSIFTITFAVYTVWFYNKATPSLYITYKEIKVNEKTYSIEDVNHIDFTGKQPFKYLAPYNFKEGAEISFKNGNVFYIYDELYANTSSIKTFLYKVYNNKEVIHIPANIYNIKSEAVHYYTGGFFSNNKIVVITLTLVGIITLIIFNTGFSIIIPVFALFIFLVLSLIFSGEMYYFGVSENYFVVRNHVLFWKKEVYSLQFVNEIVFEKVYKYRKGLRLITKNYNTDFYTTTTLSADNYPKLKYHLEKQGIKIRDELNF